MANNDQEIEVKFYLHHLDGLEERLKARGAKLEAERVHETNLRFDLPDHSLQQSGQVLRLRRDANNVVTFKGPGRGAGGANARQEIEYRVDDFEAARRVFEALGYRVSVMYEKYRTTFRLGDVLVTLDEMPYGSFAEIEGAGSGDSDTTAADIQAAAEALGLDWEARITSSYMALFDSLRTRLGLQVKNLSFEEMKGIAVSPEDLQLNYADLE
jgi:adenylate cyclase, class 2